MTKKIKMRWPQPEIGAMYFLTEDRDSVAHKENKMAINVVAPAGSIVLVLRKHPMGKSWRRLKFYEVLDVNGNIIIVPDQCLQNRVVVTSTPC